MAMKILFDHPLPFMLAHGGFQVQIEQTKRALEDSGVTVEYLRWWDAEQSGDIVHYFGRPNSSYIKFAQGKGMAVVMTDLVTGLGSRSQRARLVQGTGIKIIRSLFPPSVWNRMAWDSYREADRVIALTDWEAKLMTDTFDAPADNISVVPNGVEDAFLLPQPHVERGSYLVCTATITERKRVLELAAAAVEANTPIRIIGQPYSNCDEYALQFLKIAGQFPEIIRYQGAVQDRDELANIYRRARGFVLLSTMESFSLSALEASACGCPLLLSDLPWARTVFGDAAVYCPVAGKNQTSSALKAFYEQAPDLRVPPKPLSWTEVGLQLKRVYQEVLNEARQPGSSISLTN